VVAMKRETRFVSASVFFQRSVDTSLQYKMKPSTGVPLEAEDAGKHITESRR